MAIQSITLQSKTPFWAHQLKALEFCYFKRAAMLALEMGCGKSKVVVDLITNRNHKKVLIVCPKNVLQVWPTEFRKHSASPAFIYPLTKGTVADKTAEAKEILNAWSDQPVILVINYESARESTFSEFALNQVWDLVVADESHKLKSPSSTTSKFMYRLGRVCKYRLALTGTPFGHDPLDIFGQFRFLNPSIFGTTFYRFKARYAITKTVGNFPKIIGYQNEDELNKKFYSLAYRVSSEVLDLPEAIHVEKRCDLGTEAKRVYSELEKQFYSQIDSGEITVKNALTKVLKLQQVTSGFVKTDEGLESRIDNAKLNLLSEIIDDIDSNEPLVVFARFTNDITAIKSLCIQNKISYGELSGKHNDLKDWQNGKTRLLVVQIQSGNAGIDLTRSKYCIYYSTGCPALSDYQQSLKRVHRPGQLRNVIYIHLVVSSSIDTRVYKALSNREEIINSILTIKPSNEDSYVN